MTIKGKEQHEPDAKFLLIYIYIYIYNIHIYI